MTLHQQQQQQQRQRVERCYESKTAKRDIILERYQTSSIHSSAAEKSAVMRRPESTGATKQSDAARYRSESEIFHSSLSA